MKRREIKVREEEEERKRGREEEEGWRDYLVNERESCCDVS